MLGSRWGRGWGLAEAYKYTRQQWREPSGPGPGRDITGGRVSLLAGGLDFGHGTPPMGLARAEGQREHLREGHDQELEARASPLGTPSEGIPQDVAWVQTPDSNSLGQE